VRNKGAKPDPLDSSAIFELDLGAPRTYELVDFPKTEHCDDGRCRDVPCGIFCPRTQYGRRYSLFVHFARHFFLEAGTAKFPMTRPRAPPATTLISTVPTSCG
jgi:hypothetical protein